MRVLWILNELLPSGAENMLRVAAPHWAAHDIEVDVLSLGRVEGLYANVLRAAGYRILHLPIDPPKQFILRYRTLLREQHYDVIHIHPERAAFQIALLARAFSRARVLRTVHNVFPFVGALRIERAAQRGVLRAARVKYIAVGESVAETEWVTYRNRTQIIYNWYDDETFQPGTEASRSSARAALGLDDDDFIVLTVGNCSDVKNHGVVLRVLPRLPSSLPWRYVHAGLEDGEQSERHLASELGLRDRVSFLGPVDNVAELLAASDCFLMPSLKEGFSIAALEALACGVPSVLSDVAGLRDLAKFLPDVWWYRLEHDDLATSIGAVSSLTGDERQALRHSQHAAVSQFFSPGRGVEQYAAMYRGEKPLGVSRH